MTTVLFVCVHNSGRSHMAEAFLNAMVHGRAQSISAGSRPGTRINPVVRTAMRELGHDMSGQQPKLLTPELMDQADRIITMGCGVEPLCPATWVLTEDWGLDDPAGQPIGKVREIRDYLKARVANLVHELDTGDQA